MIYVADIPTHRAGRPILYVAKAMGGKRIWITERNKNNHSFIELVATNKSHKITKQEIQPPTHLLTIHLLTHPCTQEKNSRGWTIILWTSFWHFWWSDQENKL